MLFKVIDFHESEEPTVHQILLIMAQYRSAKTVQIAGPSAGMEAALFVFLIGAESIEKIAHQVLKPFAMMLPKPDERLCFAFGSGDSLRFAQQWMHENKVEYFHSEVEIKEVKMLFSITAFYGNDNCSAAAALLRKAGLPVAFY